MTLPELAYGVDQADYMCPNCVTPWKCNGPHITAECPFEDPRCPIGVDEVCPICGATANDTCKREEQS